MNTSKPNKFAPRIKPLAAAVLMCTGSAVSADIVLNFGNTTAAGVNGVDFEFTCNTNNFLAGREFRMCDPSGSLGGGLPAQKDNFNGTEVWTFNNSGVMISVANTQNTGGINATVASYVDSGATVGGYDVGPSGDRNGGPGIDQGADFFGAGFGFLAPFTGSETVTAGSPHANDGGWPTASVTLSPTDASSGIITVVFPILEAQWSGTHFTLGSASGGITLSGQYTVTVAGPTTSFDYSLSGEELIDKDEDEGNGGFTGWTPQWYMVGSGTAPAAAFLAAQSPFVTAGGGTLAPTTGGPGDGNFFSDGRISLSEAVAAFGEDDGSDLPNGIENPCSGGCFDFTVTPLTATESQVVLPLSAAIPANAVYRKYNATAGWHNFDESGNNAIESALSNVSPVDCTNTGPFTAGLTQGDNCVRLTITDGGPNDSDGSLNNTVVDPGGVAKATPETECREGYVPAETGGNCVIPGQDLDFGCSVTDKPVTPLHRADWWILAAFLSLLGIRKYRKEKA